MANIFVDQSNSGIQNGSGTRPYATIAQALSDAEFIRASGEGVDIFVATGTYVENLSVIAGGADLRLIEAAAPGESNPVIAPTSGIALSVSGNQGANATITVDGFGIMGGSQAVAIASGTILGDLVLANLNVSDTSVHGVFVSPGATLDSVSITDSVFSDAGAGPGNGSGSIVLFGYEGDATIANVAIESTSAVDADQTTLSDNAIQISGFDPSTYDVTAPIGTVSISGLSITGTYQKPPIAIQGFTNLNGLTFADVTIDAAAQTFGGTLVFIDPIASSGQATAGTPGYPGNFAGNPEGTVNTLDLSGIDIVGNGNSTAQVDVFVRGTDADDVYTGTNGRDFLNAPAEGDNDLGGSDNLSGGEGDDLLFGGLGLDTLDGGMGNDAAIYSGDAAGYTFTSTTDVEGRVTGFTGVVDTNAANGDEGTDTLTSIETLTFADRTLSSADPVQVFDAAGILVGTFATIQAGVDVALDGYTVNVAAGTYAENITVGEGITLIGANDGLAGTDMTRGAETIITGSVTLGSDGITIDGFAFDTTGSSVRGGADGTVNYSDITITNSNFVGIDDDNAQFIVNGFGQGGAASRGSNWTITDNAFDGIEGNNVSAIRIERVDGLVVTGNVVDNDDASVGGRRGFQIESSSSVDLSGNTIDIGVTDFSVATDFSTADAIAAAGTYAIQISMAGGPSSNVTIDGNVLTGAYAGVNVSDENSILGLTISNNTLTGFVTGVRFETGGGNSLAASASDISVTGNTFADIALANVNFDHDSATVGANVDAYEDVTITGNTFDDTVPGINHEAPDDAVFQGNNTLVGSAASDLLIGGLDNDVLDGSGGTDTAVYRGDRADYQISTSVDAAGEVTGFTAVEDQNAADGDEGIDTLTSVEILEFADQTVTLDGDVQLFDASGQFINSYDTIQQAVDNGEAGGTVRIAAGTYDESVTVDVALAFEGAGEGLTTVSGVGSSANAFSLSGDLGDTSTVSFQDIGFDGSSTAGVSAGSGVTLGTLSISGSSFEGNGRNGLSVNNADIGQVNVEDTTFTGNGAPGSSSGDGDVQFFSFGGDIALTDLTVTGLDRGTGPGENGIQINGRGTPNLPIGDVTLTNITIAGLYEKQPLVIQEFADLDGLSIDGLTITADSRDFNTTINIDEIAGTFDFTDPRFQNIDVSGAPAEDVVAIQGDQTDDTFTARDDDSFIRGFDGADTLTGGAGSDYIVGDADPNGGSGLADGNDTLNGGAGDDNLFGNGGNDIINGQSGADFMFGGTGNDEYFVDNEGDTVVEFPGAAGGVDTVFSTIDYRLSGNIENLTLLGGRVGRGNNLDNEINGSLSSIAVVLDGLGGNDILMGSAQNDGLYGGDGDDVLAGGDGNDTLVGGDGADDLNGEGGRDVAFYGTATAGVGVNIADAALGSGDAQGDTFTSIESFLLSGFGDTFVAGSAGEFVRGSGGNDVLTGGSGADVLFGDDDDDILEGNGGNDLLYGGAGQDTLSGGAGVDTLRGDGGDDSLAGGDANDILLGGAGGDALDGGDGRDIALYNTSTSAVGVNVVDGQLGSGDAFGDTFNSIEVFILTGFSDTFIGGIADETIRGGTGEDVLSGGEGTDFLFGEGGNDTLRGDGGADQLLGGAGADVFVFSGAFGNDTVRDFQDGADLFDVSELELADGFDDLLIVNLAQGARVSVDADGDGVADSADSFTILGTFTANLSADDFIF